MTAAREWQWWGGGFPCHAEFALLTAFLTFGMPTGLGRPEHFMGHTAAARAACKLDGDFIARGVALPADHRGDAMPCETATIKTFAQQ